MPARRTAARKQPAKPRTGATNAKLEAEIKRQDEQYAQLAGTVTNLAKDVEQQGARTEEILSVLRGMTAAERPVSFNTARVEGAEQDHGQHEASEIVTVNSKQRLKRGRPIDVNSQEFKDKMELERFMNEMVDIHIHDADDEMADPRFTVSVNGRKWVFLRNHSYTVPRFVVNGLCQARPVRFKNQQFVDADGVRKVRYPASRGLRYNFSVESDPSGQRGTEWLKQALRAA